ncbi:HAMP domain-containing sensor histidine kinase [Aeromicrobium chenweiae]|uniref:histidine kinase n=1 Tax=Aeromicrobium chenweiae TaxID=2079793 RepID=A0A2S0WNS6_9ACTN|nr:HAMP domain-containing sensor histidine kinase [Aeromicrobium chenweiae]AWB92999.1 two-component sensor histidine kinase [Aeromicrobium chenweiae]TGN33989.1 HAMP domain-containing histidine kinase [Aeromicrobium chenweiae]
MRRLLPSSLTGRLILTSVALVAVVSVLVALAATLVMRSYLTGRLDDQLEQSKQRAQGEFRDKDPGFRPDGDDGRFCGEPPPLAQGQGAGSLTAIVTSDCFAGLVIPSSGKPRSLSRGALETLAAVKVDQQPRTIDVPALGSYRVVAATTAQGNKVVQALPTEDVDSTISSLIWWESLLALAGIAAAALAGRVLVRRQLQPLREVAATAHEVTAMPLSSGAVGEIVRVPGRLTDPTTEVGQVGEALNQLLGHVEAALDARHQSEQQARQFLADASHELRTPLSTIKGYAELGRRTGRADPDEVLAKVESEAGRMSTLVEDMLLLARLDAGRGVERRPVDLTRVVVEAVDDARVVDPERRWTIDVPAEPVTVPGDEQRLHQAVMNLLTNATRHTPPRTTVDVRVVAGDPVRLEVHDDGPGIDPDLLPTIFERFTRGDSSRTRASGGAGLGMSLVRAIMQAHGGDATVTSVPGDTTFTLTLPAD